MAATFTRMDQSTADEWLHIGAETARNQARVAERVLAMLRSLGEIVDGFATDQLTHCLQTATRAERDGEPGQVARGGGSVGGLPQCEEAAGQDVDVDETAVDPASSFGEFVITLDQDRRRWGWGGGHRRLPRYGHGGAVGARRTVM